MTVKPPTDIVLDVARAADPARVNAAVRKLDSSATDFQAALAASDGTSFSGSSSGSFRLPGSGMLTGGAKLANTGGLPSGSHTSASFRKLEAFFLQTVLQQMMPSKASSVFGKGTAGSVWRSMLSEQVANQVAKSGSLGIATRLTHAQDIIDEARAAAASGTGGAA